MTEPISYYLGDAKDPYASPFSKPSLQQYDNYQIHDLYCDDIVYQELQYKGETITPPSNVQFRNFLAVERVSPFGRIECDFQVIAIMYP